MHTCYYMFYELQLGNDTSTAAHHICATLDVTDCTCRSWFKRFHEGNTPLENRPRSEHPLQSDNERIKVLIEDNPLLTTRE